MFCYLLYYLALRVPATLARCCLRLSDLVEPFVVRPSISSQPVVSREGVSIPLYSSDAEALARVCCAPDGLGGLPDPSLSYLEGGE